MKSFKWSQVDRNDEQFNYIIISRIAAKSLIQKIDGRDFNP